MQDEVKNEASLWTPEPTRNGSQVFEPVAARVSSLRLRPFTTIAPVLVPWLWKDRLARGMFTPLVADGGSGKGYICTDVMARFSRGDVMPDGSPNPFGGRPMASIILESEDSPDHTLRPRLDQQRADLDHVFFLEVKGHGDFDFSRHLEELEALVSAHPDVVFMMISAVNDFMPAGVKTGVDTEVRRLVLNPLMGFLRRTYLASIGIHHIGKSTERVAHHRTLDSVAWINKPRLALGAIVTQREDNGPTVGEMGGLRNRLGQEAPSLGYVIDSTGLRWTGPTGNRMKDLFEQEGHVKKEHGPSKRSQAEDLLTEMLAGGPADRDVVLRAAEDRHISEMTLRRAREDLGIVTIVTPFRQGRGTVSQWALPGRTT